MRTLLIHAEEFSYEVKSKAISEAEENIKGREKVRLQNTLVVFTAVEDSDCCASCEYVTAIGQDICNHAHKVKAKNIVLYPYAHLSSNLAKPGCALRVLENLETVLSRICTDISVMRAPFGWYKAFRITCYGHPLSELSREYRLDNPQTFLDVSKLLEQLKCKILLKEDNELHVLEVNESRYAKAISLLKQLLSTVKNSLELDKNYVNEVRRLANRFGVFNHNFLGKGEVILTEIRRLNESVIQQVEGKELKVVKIASLGCCPVVQNELETDLHALCSSLYFNMKRAGIISDGADRALLAEVPWRMYMTQEKVNRGGMLASDTAQVFFKSFNNVSEALNSAVNITNVVAKVLTKCLGIELMAVVLSEKDFLKEVISKLRLRQVIGVSCSVNNKIFEIVLTASLGKTHVPLTSMTVLCPGTSYAVATTLLGPFLRLVYVIFSNALQAIKSGRTPCIPVCLSPTQVRIIPVKPEHRNYAEAVCSRLISEGVRAEVDARNTGLGRRIRDAGKEWIPYVVVVGDREVLSGTVNVRMRAEGIQRSMNIDELVSVIKTACPFYK